MLHHFEMSKEQREFIAIGTGLKILAKLNTIQPVDAKFEISSNLLVSLFHQDVQDICSFTPYVHALVHGTFQSKIEIYTTSAMLCPTAPGYNNDAHRVVMVCVKFINFEVII